MNKLDILPQNMSWRTDGIAGKLAPSSGDSGNGDSRDQANLIFAAFIQDLSDEAAVGGGGASETGRSSPTLANLMPQEKSENSSETTDDTSGPDASQVALGPDWSSLATLMQQPRPGAQQVVAAPQDGAIPRISAASTPASDSASSLFDLLGSQSGAEDADGEAINLSNMPRQKASVLHQEAHFKPVLLASGAASTDHRNDSDQNIVPLMSAQEEANAKGAQERAGREIGTTVKNGDASRSRGDVPAGADAAGGRDAEPSTMHAVTHRVTNAIIDEAKAMPVQQDSQIRRAEAFSPLGTIRPSEGVVRILNIQLHPVELGTVTVKMKLSGDQLEMELHVARDEAAEVLKRDSEKLTSLLRMSGYRPDVLTIHTAGTDSAQASGQRQSSSELSQPQSGSFEQGTSGSDGRSREQSQEARASTRHASNDELDEKPSSRRSIDSLYL